MWPLGFIFEVFGNALVSLEGHAVQLSSCCGQLCQEVVKSIRDGENIGFDLLLVSNSHVVWD